MSEATKTPMPLRSQPVVVTASTSPRTAPRLLHLFLQASPRLPELPKLLAHSGRRCLKLPRSHIKPHSKRNLLRSKSPWQNTRSSIQIPKTRRLRMRRTKRKRRKTRQCQRRKHARLELERLELERQGRGGRQGSAKEESTQGWSLKG